MVTVSDVLNRLSALAPVETKMDFDNVGLLVGDSKAPVTKILVSLDITDDVIREAQAWGAELICSHHPLFFELKSVSDSTGEGRRVMHLCRAGIAAICMHTNLDAAQGGVNDALAAALGIENTSVLAADGIGRVGTLSAPMSAEAFVPFVRRMLRAPGVRYVAGEKPIRKVAVVGGSGGSDLETVISLGCDAFVTADMKYHGWMRAKEAGLTLVDAGHFHTENVIVSPLQQLLSETFPETEVKISEIHGETEQYFVE